MRIAGERIASGYYAQVTDLVEEPSNEADVLDVLDTDDETTALHVATRPALPTPLLAKARTN